MGTPKMIMPVTKLCSLDDKTIMFIFVNVTERSSAYYDFPHLAQTRSTKWTHMTETHTVLSSIHSVRCCISLPTLSLVFVYFSHTCTPFFPLSLSRRIYY